MPDPRVVRFRPRPLGTSVPGLRICWDRVLIALLKCRKECDRSDPLRSALFQRNPHCGLENVALVFAVEARVTDPLQVSTQSCIGLVVPDAPVASRVDLAVAYTLFRDCVVQEPCSELGDPLHPVFVQARVVPALDRELLEPHRLQQPVLVVRDQMTVPQFVMHIQIVRTVVEAQRNAELRRVDIDASQDHLPRYFPQFDGRKLLGASLLRHPGKQVPRQIRPVELQISENRQSRSCGLNVRDVSRVLRRGVVHT